MISPELHCSCEKALFQMACPPPVLQAPMNLQRATYSMTTWFRRRMERL
jgi:hypothetical protein